MSKEMQFLNTDEEKYKDVFLLTQAILHLVELWSMADLQYLSLFNIVKGTSFFIIFLNFLLYKKKINANSGNTENKKVEVEWCTLRHKGWGH